MRLLADIFDASGNRIGEGPITTVISASVTRELSGTGQFSLTVPGSDYRALEHLSNENRIKLWVWDGDNQPKRLLCEGIIRKIAFREDAGGPDVVISGPDILDELKRQNTWLGWTRNNQAVSTIVSNLVAEAPDWVADVSSLAALTPLSVRFDGASVLKALQEVVSQKGIHFRLGEGKYVEFGAFGISNGLIISQAEAISPELEANKNLCLIERIGFQYDSEAVANRIVVLGPGDAEAALSLKYSTRTAPYPIKTMQVNGKDLYYLEDAASVNQYGPIEAVFRASGVSALSNSTADLQNASNALYDLAAAWLVRHAVRQEVYQVSLKKVTKTIRPGDKVWVDYRGIAYQNGQAVRWVKLRGDYWVTGVTERFGQDGVTVDLEISNIDRNASDVAQIILGNIDELRVQSAVVKPYLSKDTVSFPERAIDANHSVTFPLKFGAYTARLNQVLLRLWTRPFRSNVQSVAAAAADTVTSTSEPFAQHSSSTDPGAVVSSVAAGVHRHVIAYNGGPTSAPSNWRRYDFSISDLDNVSLALGESGTPSGLPLLSQYVDNPHSHNVTIPAHFHTVDIPAHDHDVTIPPHSHDMQYGIYDDIATPANLKIYVDNVLVVQNLAPSGGNLTYEIDITSFFPETGFQGDHTIRIECVSGQGAVEGQIEVRETIQSIRAI
jgi:hypothetical protein